MNANPVTARRRRHAMLLERLEDRVLFDVVPIVPLDPAAGPASPVPSDAVVQQASIVDSPTGPTETQTQLDTIQTMMDDPALAKYTSFVQADKSAMEADPAGYVASLFENYDAIILPTGTIDIGRDTIVIPSNKAILSVGSEPATLTGVPRDAIVSMAGETSGETYVLKADVLRGSNTFRISAGSNLAPGDWIAVRASSAGPISVSTQVVTAESASDFSGPPALSPWTGAYQGQIVYFTSGALAGEARVVTDYDSSTNTFTVNAPFSQAPAAGDSFNVWSNQNTTKGTPQQLLRVASVTNTDGYDQVVVDGLAEFDYLASGAPTTADLVKVVPTVGATLHNVNLNGVKIRLALADDINIFTPDIRVNQLISMSKTDQVASANVTIRAQAFYDVGDQARHIVQLVGISHLNVDLYQYGGAKDGPRIFGCSDIVARIRTEKIQERSAWLYMANHAVVDIVATDSLEGPGGNIETVLFDYASNIRATRIFASGMADGDGIEIRGTSQHLDLDNVTVVTEAGGKTLTAIHIHGALVDDVHLKNFYLIGATHAIDIRDGARNVWIEDGEIVKRSGDRGSCIRFGRSMTRAIENLHVARVRFVPEEGKAAVLGNDGDDRGFMMRDISVTDSIVVAPGSMDSYIRIFDAEDVTLMGNSMEWPGTATPPPTFPAGPHANQGARDETTALTAQHGVSAELRKDLGGWYHLVARVQGLRAMYDQGSAFRTAAPFPSPFEPLGSTSNRSSAPGRQFDGTYRARSSDALRSSDPVHDDLSVDADSQTPAPARSEWIGVSVRRSAASDTNTIDATAALTQHTSAVTSVYDDTSGIDELEGMDGDWPLEPDAMPIDTRDTPAAEANKEANIDQPVSVPDQGREAHGEDDSTDHPSTQDAHVDSPSAKQSSGIPAAIVRHAT